MLGYLPRSFVPALSMSGAFTLTATRIDTPPTPVPEPTSLVLLGTGILGLTARRRTMRA